MSGFAPKKGLSQNFLTDPKTADKIVKSLEATAGDAILEIGPGTGVLTQRLIKTGANIVGVDVDQRAIDHVKAQAWASSPLLTLTQADVLTLQLRNVFPRRDITAVGRKVIGNIPYSITSDILFWLFEQRKDIERAVIMMQREVAQRLVAEPRSKEYGVLSIASWFASETKILFHVKPGSFFPKPAVTSSVVLFRFRREDPIDATMGDFMAFVRASFSQRRKVLSNSLRTYLQGDNRATALVEGVDLGRTRAEELTPMQLFDVYRSIRNLS
ncbi:MAG: 16S rRNA (adenine(1518)-N(6)/adenine(1519)-N(6))-dimethyltransferase RsmA [bacterium]|nr:16S rRNA (adenine(1518)-N(6)/adenine(1519)-N(6))-dimethyltransferase RsmA [bacterium]